MSEDSYTEVSSESWFSRLGGAFKGIIAGFVLVLSAFVLLFWNEGRAVKTYKTLKEGGAAVVSAAADRVDPANEGKLVHLSGKAVTEATLADPVFGVSANALRLRRAAEMYQWQESAKSETRKKLGGGTETETTYTYSKAWSGQPVRSSGFKKPEGHENPGSMPYLSEERAADRVTLGAFVLPPSLVSQISGWQPLPVSGSLPAELAGTLKRHGQGLYLGADPAAPQIGDVRITFEIVPPAEVSVLARQAGHSLAPYQTKAGGAIERLQTGTATAGEMFRQAEQENTFLTWALRAGGFFLMFFGLGMMFKVLSVAADLLPVLGTVVGAGTGVIAFLIAAVLSLTTIAVAWIVYRPLLGGILLAAAAVLLVLIKGRMGKAAPQAAVPPPPPPAA